MKQQVTPFKLDSLNFCNLTVNITIELHLNLLLELADNYNQFNLELPVC